MKDNLISSAIQKLSRILLARDATGQGAGKLLQCFVDHRDEAAFEALVRRHGPMVLGVCHRILANSHDTEDAFQATFLVLARRAASIVPREAVGNWLYGVAVNVARKARAMSAKRQARERLMENFPDSGGRPDSNLPALQALLDEELSRFPDKYRMPLVLCGLEGKTPKEAALELGWPEGTFSGRLSRARQFLARRLARHGITLPGAAVTGLLFEQAASATVPAALLASAIRLGTLTVTGTGSGAALVPAGVAALAEGVVSNYWVSKFSWSTAFLLLVSVFGGGGFLAYQTLFDKPATMKGDDASSGFAERPTLLAADPKDNKRPVPRETLLGEAGTKPSIAISPGAKILAATGLGDDGERTIRLWNPATGKSLKVLQGHRDRVHSVSLSANRKTLASSTNTETWIWDISSGTHTATLPETRCVAFHPNGEILAWVDLKNNIRLWDIPRDETKYVLKEENGPIGCVIFSPDGKRLIFSLLEIPDHTDNFIVRVCDLESKNIVTDLKWPRNPDIDGGARARGERIVAGSIAMAVSPDGTTLATADQRGSINLWDLASRKVTAQFSQTFANLQPNEIGTSGFNMVSPVSGLAFGPGGKELVAAGGGVIRLWDLASRKSIGLETAFKFYRAQGDDDRPFPDESARRKQAGPNKKPGINEK